MNNLAHLGHPAGMQCYQARLQYELEVAHNLINFDFKHANEISKGDIKRLAEKFCIKTCFIAR